MILLRKAITYATIAGLGALTGYKVAQNNTIQNITQENHLVPKSSYCLEMDQPLNEYFENNFNENTKPIEVYTHLELIAKQCGK